MDRTLNESIEPSWLDQGMSMGAGDHLWTMYLTQRIRQFSPGAAAELLPEVLADPKLYFLLYHLARLNDFTASSVMEVGAGFGWFAQKYLDLNPAAEYHIIDLPWRHEELHWLNPSAKFYAPDKWPDIEVDLFVSTWGLCETPTPVVDAAIENKFFGAKKLLLAYRTVSTPGLPHANYLWRRLSQLGCPMISATVPWDKDSRYTICDTEWLYNHSE